MKDQDDKKMNAQPGTPHLKYLTLGLVLLCLGSYQHAFAADNGFSVQSIRTGDNVLSLMRKHGFSLIERERALREAPGLRHLMLTTDMNYFVSKPSNTVKLKIFDAQSDRAYVLKKSKQEGLSVETQMANFRVSTVKHDGRLRGSLMGTLIARIPSNWVASRFMDAFIMEKDLRDLPAGARFAMTVEKKYEGTNFVKYGEVLQASLEFDGRVITKNFVRVGTGGVFITSKDLLSERPFYAPVDYLRIASVFQPSRRHPVTRKRQAHLGIDFELNEGEPVFAPRRGTVVRMGRNRAAGNYIVLLHSNGIETSYNHLRKLDWNLRQGQVVNTGQKLAEVGCTGYCTRPHLHFAVRVRGRMVDPAPYIKAFPSHFEERLQRRIASAVD